MKVLTYNIRGWQALDDALNVDRLADVIAASGADLVGLNEVFHPYPAEIGPALAQLAERVGMTYAFAPTIAVASSPDAIPYGNVVLSRWPILAHAAHHLTPVTAYGRRGLLEARVLLPNDRPFTLYVTHLDHRSEELRVAQWKATRMWLTRDRDRPHLLLGDFNALSASDYADADAYDRLVAYNRRNGWGEPAFDLVSHVLRAGYADAFAQAGEGAGPTWPVQRPERRIDYIFLPDILRPALVACQLWKTPTSQVASDHLPLLAEFAW